MHLKYIYINSCYIINTHTYRLHTFFLTFPTSSPIALIILRNEKKKRLDLLLQFLSKAIGTDQRVYLGFFHWNSNNSTLVQNKSLASLFLNSTTFRKTLELECFVAKPLKWFYDSRERWREVNAPLYTALVRSLPWVLCTVLDASTQGHKIVRVCSERGNLQDLSPS